MADLAQDLQALNLEGTVSTSAGAAPTVPVGAAVVESPRPITVDPELKKEWNGLSQDQCDRAVEIVRKVWDGRSAVDSSFFSLFKSKTVEGIIGRITCNVIDYRSGHSSGGNGTNLLITGVRGVGKTTLMRGLWNVLSNLQDNLIAVYHDYETGRALRPAKLIFKFFKATGRKLPDTISRADSFATILQKLWSAGFRVAMFLDEIQTLFVPVTSKNYPKFLGILKDILVLGKSEYDCFGVLSGSTSNVRDLAYHEDPIAIAGGYPNLNHNVYCQYHLSPVRDREELRSIMPPDTPDKQIDACFMATGGVGRSIKRYISHEGSYAKSDQKFRRELSQNEAFFALIAKMWKHKESMGHACDLPRFEYNEVKDIVAPRLEDPNIFYKVLLRWLDSGFLYERAKDDIHFTYEILVPSHLIGFSNYVNNVSAEAFTSALRAAVLGTISRIGWDGEGSAGHLIERYICQRLHDNVEFWEPFSEETPDEYVGAVSLTETVAKGTVTRRLFSLTKDCGTEDPAHPDDTVMKGIVFKARRGIEAILNGLRGKFNITRITFTLVTTKMVAPKAATFLGANFWAGDVQVACRTFGQKETLALFDPSLRRIIGETPFLPRRASTHLHPPALFLP